MLKNHSFARNISDCSWSSFINMLQYKADWYGKNIVFINKFSPSSKTCSCCGWINNDLKLNHREWQCEICSTEHDRDINAAINIKRFGLNKTPSGRREELVEAVH